MLQGPVVGKVGLEPTCSYERRGLNPVRLPISPLPVEPPEACLTSPTRLKAWLS